MQTALYSLKSFLLRFCDSIRKKAWARLATLRISEGLIALSLGFLICVLFRKTHTMQQFSCAFRQRHSRIADTCEVCFTSLCIVALWAVAKACLLGKHWNCACYSDIAQSTHWSERYKAKSLSKSYVVWRHAQSFLSDANQDIGAKNFDQLDCAVCKIS